MCTKTAVPQMIGETNMQVAQKLKLGEDFHGDSRILQVKAMCLDCTIRRLTMHLLRKFREDAK